MKEVQSSVILIVDDKEANILALENLLVADDRKFLSAGSGKEALKIALNNDVDLILLDVQMPDMDGFEVAQVLQSNKRTKNIPLIFATAGSKERKFVIQGYDEGAIDYLIKPLDPQIVKAKVSVLLKIQLQKKELHQKNISLQKSALLIENSADIIGIIDEETHTIEEMNSAFSLLLGYPVEEFEGKKLDFFLAEESVNVLAELPEPSDNYLTFETCMNNKDRSKKWLQWKVVVKNEKWFVNARDITEQKEAAGIIQKLNSDLKNSVQELEASNKELESFSYSVSHDLRAPLRAMGGYSEILEETTTELNEEAKKIVAKIIDGVVNMGRLIDNLLEFSRLGRSELHRTKINMQETVVKVIHEIEKTIAHKAEIKMKSLPPVQADYYLLQQVLINLISNAIKYSAKKEFPVIEIGATTENGDIIYYVRDNGVGFDMKYSSKLFGVFQRLHGAKDFEGVGVGLAIVHRIVTKHGGKVWADAKVNAGATFSFTLPAERIN